MQRPNRIDSTILQRVFFRNTLPVGVGGVGDNQELREPMGRIIRQLGETRNPAPLIPTERQLNMMKGRLVRMARPMDRVEFTRLVDGSTTGLMETAHQSIMTTMRLVSVCSLGS